MYIDWWTFALESANFLILMAILRRFLYKPVLNVIARRQQAIAESLADAQTVRTEADGHLAEYQQALAGLAAERDTLLAEDRAVMQNERRRILEQTRAEADDLAHSVREQLSRERSEALADVREQSVKTAVVMAEKLLHDADVHSITEMFFTRACADLESLPAGELAHLVKPRGAEARIRVVTAAPLSATTEESWRARLVDMAGDVDISFAVDDTLVAGVELIFSGAVVRFSWGDTLRRIEQELVADARAA